MFRDISYLEIERIVYIWGRYAGTRNATPEGKHYSRFEIKELIARLERFMKDPNSFDDGFEKVLEEDEDVKSELSESTVPDAVKGTAKGTVKSCDREMGYRHTSGTKAYCGDDVGTHIIYCKKCLKLEQDAPTTEDKIGKEFNKDY